ncbi:MAG: hypothetical protein KA479_03245 [Saprospiraceae bacterium]|nr:hypothetical protein [Saprospiraceae bacterium]
MIAIKHQQESLWAKVLPIGIPFVLTLFLFFIDEGYYSFEWMQDPGNWVPFFIYWGSMILGEFLVHSLLPATVQGTRRLALIIVLGIPIGLFALFFLFMGWMSLADLV